MFPLHISNNSPLCDSLDDSSHPFSIAPYLAKSLVNATPEQQKLMLGEALYPIVEKHEPLWTAKVTGMLLELDQSSILHLLESPDDLKAKVKEAIQVLGDWILQQLQLQSLRDPPSPSP